MSSKVHSGPFENVSKSSSSEFTWDNSFSDIARECYIEFAFGDLEQKSDSARVIWNVGTSWRPLWDSLYCLGYKLKHDTIQNFWTWIGGLKHFITLPDSFLKKTIEAYPQVIQFALLRLVILEWISCICRRESGEFSTCLLSCSFRTLVGSVESTTAEFYSVLFNNDLQLLLQDETKRLPIPTNCARGLRRIINRLQPPKHKENEADNQRDSNRQAQRRALDPWWRRVQLACYWDALETLPEQPSAHLSFLHCGLGVS